MGVTKQAAQKRFVPKGPGEPSELDPSSGFSRFNDHARHAVVASQNAAHDARNDRITSAHLVLGLLSQPDSAAARVLAAHGLSLDRVRQEATATLPEPAADLPALTPFDPGAKKALELTFREALRLGDSEIGTEHILLALLELEDGTGVLAGLGLDKAAVEATVTADR